MRLIAVIACSALLASPGAVTADIIYFKDGMRTVCQGRVWEEKNEVKCDYDGVVLSYRKEDVEQIHKTMLSAETDGPQSSEAAISDETAPAEIPPSPPASNTTEGGTAFYDPRRPYKYWSSPSAKHHTYLEAVEALASEFGRSKSWIEKKIGDTNNLERIRRMLSQSDEAPEAAVTSSGDDKPVAGGTMFYSPRRDYKYQISATQKYQTFEEAIDALAQEYKATPEWVEDNMGEHNDIAVIRENLRRRKSEDAVR